MRAAKLILHGAPPFVTAILIGGAVFVVIVLYSVRWKLPRRIVASTRLWTGAVGRRRGGGRLDAVEHLGSLLLQLLIVACLVGAAAQPRFSCQAPAGGAVMLVLDRSPSMAALEKVESRLDTARRRAYARLDMLPAADRVGLVLGGGEPEILAPLSTDIQPVRQAIARASVRVGPSRLADAVGLACAMLTQPASLIVVTDGTEPVGSCAAATPEVIVVGTERPNLGIVAFGASVAAQRAGTAEALVEVLNASTSTAQAELRIDLDGSLQRVIPLELAAGKRDRHVVDGIPLGGPGHLVARLQHIRFGGRAGDALPDDDVAYALLPRSTGVAIDLIGRDKPLELALAANPRFQIFARSAPRPGAVTVVVGPIAAPLPPGRYLLIDPSGPGAPRPTGATLANPRITRWREDHPILRGLVLSDLVIGAARAVTLEPADVELAAAGDAPLLYTIDDGARRIVALAFDPESSNLPLRVGFPVLIYNALAWLDEASSSVEEGDAFIAAAGPLGVTDPAGRRRVVDPIDGRVHLSAETAGFYRIDSDGKPLAERAVSVADASETSQAPVVAATASARGRLVDRDLARRLLVVALMLLVLEWATYHRRKTV